MVTMVPVQSTNIVSLGYDYQSNEMHIKFHHGGTTVYSHHKDRPMTGDLFQKFLTAESQGKFFHAEIKGKFPYRPFEEGAKS